VLDDEERRRRRDAEALDEVRALLLVDPIELERAVVAPALEDLSEEPVDAPAGAGRWRIEKDQTRLPLGGGGRAADDVPPAAGEIGSCVPGDGSGLTAFCSGSAEQTCRTTRNPASFVPSNLARCGGSS